MIVKPISAPAPQSADVGNQPHSPEALARAKAAFTGTTMSQSDTPVDPGIERTRQSIRTLKMKTNASPERFIQEAQAENAKIPTDGQTGAVIEDTKPLSPQYAALARQQRALQVKERELNAKLKSMESQAPKVDASELIARLKAQPLSVLQEAGVTYEQLTEAILANPSNPELQALEDRLKSVEENFDKKISDRDQAQRQQVLSEMRSEAIELAKQGDDFELVRTRNKIPDVLRLIERTFDTTGEIMDVKEAMALMETELVKEAMKYANIGKIRKSIVPAQPAQQMQPQRQMRTLTNRDTATPPMSRKARAIAAFIGNTQK